MSGSKDGCTFCSIAVGDQQSSFLVSADEATVAFLDRRPLFPGHCLVIPRSHYETLPELPDDLVGSLFESVRALAAAVTDAMAAHGSFVAINNKVSQSVPHLHVHVVPRKFKDGLKGFFWPRQSYGEGQAAGVQAAIRESLKALT